MRIRTRRFTTLALAVLLITSCGVSAKDASDEFSAHLDRIERLIEAGEYKKAKGKAVRFEQEMVDRIIGGPQVPEYLGEIARLHAIALAGVGEMDHAAWKWQMARAISPETIEGDIEAYGDAGKVLDKFLKSQAFIVEPSIFEGAAATPPLPTKQPDIRYPKAQGKLKLHGSVVVRIVIGTDGRPHNPQIVRLSGRPIMAYSTLIGLRRWKFEPSMVDGRPTNAFMTITMNF